MASANLQPMTGVMNSKTVRMPSNHTPRPVATNRPGSGRMSSASAIKAKQTIPGGRPTHGNQRKTGPYPQ